MTASSPIDSLDVFVWEGTSGIADRVARSLASFEVEVIRADGLLEPPGEARALRPAIAIVSVSLMNAPRSSVQVWLAGQGMPVIWVAAHDREVAPGFYPHVYTNILPPGFTGPELRTLVMRLAGEVRQSAPAAPAPEPLVAVSATMRELLAEAQAYADCQANVMVYGETGVGKERIARLLHDGNRRYGRGAFVGVNCGAIPDGLFESQFFGHAKGAFTGAVGMHKGYFEQANGGTLFLDEVGDLPLHQQVKLLRVLEQNTVTRLGATVEIGLDFRLVAATHRNLPRLVAEGEFRADLYYRLAVVELHVPTLEQRGPQEKAAIFQTLLARALPDDAEPLPEWLIARVAGARYAGNVRELRNVAERVALVRRQFGSWDEVRIGRVLSRPSPDSLGGVVPAGGGGLISPDAPAPLDARERAERERVVAALEANGWRRQDTAAYLGISRKVLWEKMRKLRIESAQAEDEASTPSGVFF